MFPATNSITKYGIGFIFPLFDKYRMNGVKVNITISLEVNTVKIEINIYKTVNNLNCELLYFETNKLEIYLKNPLSSNVIEMNEIDINNINIFKGFKLVLDVIEFQNTPKLLFINRMITAPINGHIKNVSI